jgi:hypothetical protein
MQDQVTVEADAIDHFEPQYCTDCNTLIEDESDLEWVTVRVHTPTVNYATPISANAVWNLPRTNVECDCEDCVGVADTLETYLERMMSSTRVNISTRWRITDVDRPYCLDCSETPKSSVDCEVDGCCESQLTPIFGSLADFTVDKVMAALRNGISESNGMSILIDRLSWAMSGDAAEGKSYNDFVYDNLDREPSPEVLEWIEKWIESTKHEEIPTRISLEIDDRKRWHMRLSHWLCDSHEDYAQCNSCEEWSDDLTYVEAGWSDYNWCEACLHDGAEYCDDCDRWEHNEYDCEYRCSSGIIKNYSYKPEPDFYGVNSEGKSVIVARGRVTDRTLYMGFELEVEARDNHYPSELASHVEMSWGDAAYFKEDGSLYRGVEIVTHPHTLAAFKTLDWSVLPQIAGMGARSWDTDSCGFHVHLSRSAFKGVRHLWLFGQFFAQNGDQIVAIAGRNGSYGRLDEDFKREVGRMAKGRHGERYNAINFQNSHTIEVRVFKGSLKVERVHAYLELCESIHRYTATITANGVLSKAKSWKEAASKGALSWGEFAEFVRSNSDTYPALVSYMDTLSI